MQYVHTPVTLVWFGIPKLIRYLWMFVVIVQRENWEENWTDEKVLQSTDP